MFGALSITVVLLTALSVVCPKEIKKLPGLSHALSFKHYSGYLKASETHRLHYWFVEAQQGASTAPLIVWLNGGPGCSSVDGLLTELGPFLINDDGATFRQNPFAWNQRANLVVFESPAGVGYSYSTDGDITTGDNQTAWENREALIDFLTKFPQYRHRDLYIIGESYAGVYVPTFVAAILDGQAQFQINLKGLAIGNGAVSFPMDTDTLIKFGYHHGFVDERVWKNVSDLCCGGCTDDCELHKSQNPYCQNEVASLTNMIWLGGLNPYDLYKNCWHKPTHSTGAHTATRFLTDARHKLGRHPDSVSRLATNQHRPQVGKDVGIPCMNETAITNYLNRQDVRKALYIPATVGSWSVCNMDFSYRKETDNVYPQIRKAIDADIRILLYYGDTDMACNFMMGQRFAASLGLHASEAKRMWHFNDQIAGFVTKYDRNVTFLTVKGSGHMVPQDKPGPAFHVIDSFITGVDV